MRAMPYPRTIANGTAEAASKAGPERPPLVATSAAAAAVVACDVWLRVSTKFLKMKGTCCMCLITESCASFGFGCEFWFRVCFWFGTELSFVWFKMTCVKPNPDAISGRDFI